MAKVCTKFPVTGTFSGITFYMAAGKNLARKKSSLTGRRVKTSPRFANTRVHAGILSQASVIASVIYQGLPPRWRQFWMFRSFTGEAMQLLKAGKTKEEAIAELWRVYVEEHEGRTKRQKTKDKEKRKYQKADNAYWENKTAKAGKRKAQKEKLQHYAGLMAKASKIGSAVYRSLPAVKRHRGHYRSITGLAMQWLKEGLLEEEVRALLMEEVGMKDPKNKKQETNKIQNTKPEVVIPCQALAKSLAKDAAGSTKIYIPVRRMGSVFCIPRVQSSSTKRNRLFLNMPP